jgi:uncharacterized protein YwgA
MTHSDTLKTRAHLVAQIVSESGGEIVGRTKFQKLAFLLELSGHGFGIPFEYKHYGPYSEQLAEATNAAALFGLLDERKESTHWGGFYSIYSSAGEFQDFETNTTRQRIAELAVGANAIELELAATAAFLATEGFDDPWTETCRRKPDKCSNGRVERAKTLYQSLKAIPNTDNFPDLV